MARISKGDMGTVEQGEDSEVSRKRLLTEVSMFDVDLGTNAASGPGPLRQKRRMVSKPKPVSASRMPATGVTETVQVDDVFFTGALRLQTTLRLMQLQMPDADSDVLGSCLNSWRATETRGALRARMTLPRILMIRCGALIPTSCEMKCGACVPAGSLPSAGVNDA